MSNSYFQFKQFTVHQERCAMKVTTDACLFGAWCAETIQNEKLKSQNALDIGSGTGLLSLMIAQKTDPVIDAVEIDQQAAEQTKENFKASPWSKRLRVINDSLQHATDHQILKSSHYQIVLSNPPFFETNLQSDNEKRNLALHSSALTLDDLFRCANKLISSEGKFFLLLPYHRKKQAVEIGESNQLFVHNSLDVRQTNNHGFFRTLLSFGRIKKDMQVGELSIKEDSAYSPAFTSLLKDFYLHL